MIKEPRELVELLKGKRVLIMAGQLCNEVEFNGKKLLDYVVEISNKLDAPIAATGNTPIPLREKGAKLVTKMWAMELVNYMRWQWEAAVMEQKPEVLLLIGYAPTVAQSIVSTVKDEDGATMVLGNTYIEGATYSLPNSPSLKHWQQNLEQLVKSLGGVKNKK
jgi:CO dehydrogenase/acetyl-CoA synthase epsilon subunit